MNALGLSITILLLVSVASAQVSFLSFTKSQQLSPAYTLYWSLSDANITFGVDVASNGNWVGLGIAEPTSGSMGGADMAILQVNSGSISISDYWANGKFTPYKDDCQAWHLISSGMTTEKRVQAIFTRVLDTKDDMQDRVVNASVGYFTRFIWAFGTTPKFSQHAGSSRGAMGVFLNGSEPGSANSSWLNSTFTFTNFSIPAKETTYACVAFDLPNDQNYYIKRFEFVFANQTKLTQVHHLVMQVCQNVTAGEYQYYRNNQNYCFKANKSACTEMMWAWAPGIDSFNLPDDVSFLMGPGGAQFLLLQMHYTNPLGVSGEVDSSGVRILYDTVPTTHRAGVFQFGDVALRGAPLAPNQESIHVEYSCPDVCTGLIAAKSPLTVFGDFLHAHQYGTMMYSTHTDSNGNTKILNRIEFYDYGFQQITEKNVVINPNDRINTHCIYETKGSSDPVRFGRATTQEMCIEFIFYYPKVTNYIEACTLAHYSGYNGTFCANTFIGTNPRVTDSATWQNKSFGPQPKVCWNYASGKSYDNPKYPGFTPYYSKSANTLHFSLLAMVLSILSIAANVFII